MFPQINNPNPFSGPFSGCQQGMRTRGDEEALGAAGGSHTGTGPNGAGGAALGSGQCKALTLGVAGNRGE